MGAGDFFKRLGQAFRPPALPPALALQFVREAEEVLKPHIGLKKLGEASRHPEWDKAPEMPDVLEILLKDTPVEQVTAGGRTLLLVHGIFDRVHGFAFSPLLLWGDLLGKLHVHYGGRVYGYDHRTVSVDPLKNAHDLLGFLPEGLDVDIICHSRGGLVVRSLIEHPEVRTGLDAKNIRVGQVIFVGAANQGSDLARSENLLQLLMIFTTHGARSQNPFAKATAAAFGPLMAAAQIVAAQGGKLPGVEALVPESDLIRTLNRSNVQMKGEPSFIRANFGNTKEPLLKRLEPISDKGFGSKLNDLVVPLAGIDDLGNHNAPGRNRLTLNDNVTPQGHWYHLNYFDSPAVRDFIKQRLGIA